MDVRARDRGHARRRGGRVGDRVGRRSSRPPTSSSKAARTAPGPVTFSHEEHKEKVGGCTACHIKIFKMKKGQDAAVHDGEDEGRASCAGPATTARRRSRGRSSSRSTDKAKLREVSQGSDRPRGVARPAAGVVYRRRGRSGSSSRSPWSSAARVLTGLWHVSASPQFCNSCHIMEPYVEAWKVSKHSEVACVQCHYPPGLRDTLWVKYQAISQVAKWATQTYSSKPFAEVEDASCLRSGCHARAGSRARARSTFKRGVRFDHRPHLEPATWAGSSAARAVTRRSWWGSTSRSTSPPASSATSRGRRRAGADARSPAAPAATSRPRATSRWARSGSTTRRSCARGVACQKCHLNVVEGDGAAPRERCFTCHNQPEKLERYTDTALVHDGPRDRATPSSAPAATPRSSTSCRRPSGCRRRRAAGGAPRPCSRAPVTPLRALARGSSLWPGLAWRRRRRSRGRRAPRAPAAPRAGAAGRRPTAPGRARLPELPPGQPPGRASACTSGWAGGGRP